MKLVGLAQHGISLNDMDRVGNHPLARLNFRSDVSSPSSQIIRDQDVFLSNLDKDNFKDSSEDDGSLFDQYLRKQERKTENLLDRKRIFSS